MDYKLEIASMYSDGGIEIMDNWRRELLFSRECQTLYSYMNMQYSKLTDDPAAQ